MKNTFTLLTLALGLTQMSNAFAQLPPAPEHRDVFPMVVMNCDFETSGFQIKYRFNIQARTNLEDSLFQATPQPQEEGAKPTSYTLNKLMMPDNGYDAVRINASGTGPDGDTLVFEIALDAKGPPQPNDAPGIRASATIIEYEANEHFVYTVASTNQCTVELQ